MTALSEVKLERAGLRIFRRQSSVLLALEHPHLGVLRGTRNFQVLLTLLPFALLDAPLNHVQDGFLSGTLLQNKFPLRLGLWRIIVL